MGGSGELSVRVIPKEHQRTDYKDVFRVYVSERTLQLLGLPENGDPFGLNITENSMRTVLIWKAPMNKGVKLHDSVIQISPQLQTLHGLNLSQKVSLFKLNKPPPDAVKVTLCELASNESGLPELRTYEQPFWAFHLEYLLSNVEILAPGVVFKSVEIRGQKRNFKIQQVNGSRDLSDYRFHPSCNVEVVDETSLDRDVVKSLVLSGEGLGGLEAQIDELNKELAAFGDDDNSGQMPPVSPGSTNGILLYGPAGTGKSLLLRKVREAGWRSVFDIDDELLSSPRVGENKAAIRKVFAEARNTQPSAILIDDLEQLIGNGEPQSPGQATAVSQTLRKEVERLGDSRVLVVAATPSLINIDQKLRSVHGFSVELGIPAPPDSRSRALILKVLSGFPIQENHEVLDNIAGRTHGFVGGDLAKLVHMAAKKANDRIKGLGLVENLKADPSTVLVMDYIINEDFDFALLHVRPTALQEVFVETPKTRWTDIGGQEEVKENLERALIWPAKYPDWMRMLNIQPGKGLLLYGPPGCSKTMTARAAATESGHNFIAVKGAEFVDKYVGESERKMRYYFSLARSVSPSILFFDEIDSIGKARGDGQHPGLNVVTTLLNELDGIEELKGVFILAATNRPEIIDSALTRAGRLDTMLYVGPPDLEARKHILEKRLMRLERVVLAGDLDILALAVATDGYSGAELMNICRIAATEALAESVDMGEEPKLGHKHFDQAIGKVDKVITPKMLADFEEFRARKHF